MQAGGVCRLGGFAGREGLQAGGEFAGRGGVCRQMPPCRTRTAGAPVAEAVGPSTATPSSSGPSRRGDHPPGALLCSRSCSRGQRGALGSASPPGPCSLAGDPQPHQLPSLAAAPLPRQGSKPTHLGLRTINFPNLRNDQLLRRTISRSQIVIVISLLILIWPNEG